MAKRAGHSRRNRMKRRASGQQTTVKSVFNAINKYPRGKGASVVEIRRILSKNGKGPKRSLSSIKMAIARAVKKGAIKAPKGWHGFRGIPVVTKKVGKDRKAKKAPSVEQLPPPPPPQMFSFPWFSREPATGSESEGSQGDGPVSSSRGRSSGSGRSSARSLSRKRSRGGRERSRRKVRSPSSKRGRGRPAKGKGKNANTSRNSSNVADTSENFSENGENNVEATNNFCTIL